VGLARLAGGRSWQLVHELAKFGIIGVLAVLVADIGTNLLHFQAGMGPLTARQPSSRRWPLSQASNTSGGV
jgi:hypothetical protein